MLEEHTKTLCATFRKVAQAVPSTHNTLQRSSNNRGEHLQRTKMAFKTVQLAQQRGAQQTGGYFQLLLCVTGVRRLHAKTTQVKACARVTGGCWRIAVCTAAVE